MPTTWTVAQAPCGEWDKLRLSDPSRTGWRWIASLLLVSGAFVWILFALWGEDLVRSIYSSQTTVGHLNNLIKRQSLHPADYYLNKGWVAARGLAWLMWSAAALIALYHTLLAVQIVRRPNQPLLLGMVFATVLLCESYLLNVPIFQLLPHWFWSLRFKELENGWILIALLPILFGALHLVFANPTKVTRNLLLLILAGTMLQYGIVAMDGNPSDGLRHRLLDTGHGGFPRAAAEGRSLVEVIADYDQLLAEGQLADYPFGTKPPGTLAFFVLCAGLAEMLQISGTHLEQVTMLATFLFPVLTYLALVPLFLISRQYVGTKEAWVPCCLYISLPNVVLMNMHLDQFLLPQLGLWFVFALVVAHRRGSVLVGVLSGVLLYLCTFVSFSLIPLAAMGSVVLFDRSTRASGTRTGTYLVLGFFCSYGLLYSIIDYNAAERVLAAVARHSQWKVESWGILSTAYFAALNTVEFALWCGLPVAVLCGGEICRSARSLWSDKRVTEESALSAALLVTGGFLLIFGRTVGETGRLWLFLAPVVAFCAAVALSRLRPDRLLSGTALMVTLQMAVILTLKRHQDFF
jgi:hypothetical protein